MPRNTATAADLRDDGIEIDSIAQAIDGVAVRLATHLHTVCTAEAERPARDDAMRARRYFDKLREQVHDMQRSIPAQIRVFVNVTTNDGRRFHGRPLRELGRSMYVCGLTFWPSEPDHPRGKPPTMLYVDKVELQSIRLEIDMLDHVD